MRLSIKQLVEACRARWVEWMGPHTDSVANDILFASTELAGETGEFCNVIKKFARFLRNVKGGVDDPKARADELADVIICAGNLAMLLGLDLDSAIRAKFNETSRKHGFKTLLPLVGDGVDLIREEREGQRAREGYDERHDDKHVTGDLAKAAACYALPADCRQTAADELPLHWPWGDDWWKPAPHDRIRELEKAGALIAAEIDRLKRKGAK